MNELKINNQQTMSSREIAELVESRHDKVKQSIERLAERGVISKPPTGDGEKSANGVVEKLYLIGKRDSYIIVAQLSPEFTAKLVDRWQELEEQQKPMTQLELIANIATAMVDQEKRTLALESDIKRLEAKITATPDNYYSVAGYYSMIGEPVDASEANRIGRAAVRLSKDLGIPTGKCHSAIYGTVNTYHVDVLSQL